MIQINVAGAGIPPNSLVMLTPNNLLALLPSVRTSLCAGLCLAAQRLLAPLSVALVGKRVNLFTNSLAARLPVQHNR